MVCPFIEICTQKVSYITYADYCRSSYSYPKCASYEEICAQTKQPREWRDAVEE